MAILTGINTRLKGSVGDYTFRQTKNGTEVSQKVARKSTPKRTAAIMKIRMQWRNIQNLYAKFNGQLHPSFESKPRNHSDYNEFMSANVNRNPIYLKKAEALAQGCVVAAYQVTRGSLPSIVVGVEPTKAFTGISLGSLIIGNSTTLADFSEAVLDNNADFENGDQITCFYAQQTTDAVTGIPMVKILAAEVTLDDRDEDTVLYDIPNVSAINFASVEGKLGANTAINGGITWVHSRKTASGTRVSTQSFVCQNTLISRYSSEGQQDKAIDSYGGLNSEDYLTPNVA